MPNWQNCILCGEHFVDLIFCGWAVVSVSERPLLFLNNLNLDYDVTYIDYFYFGQKIVIGD